MLAPLNEVEVALHLALELIEIPNPRPLKLKHRWGLRSGVPRADGVTLAY